MRNVSAISNRRGQATVENLLMTAIIAGILIPIVYKYALTPMMDTIQGQKQNLVDFIAQKNNDPVPSTWFASERLAEFKDQKEIPAPKDIDAPNDIPAPGEIPSPKDIQSPKDIKSKPIPPPKNIPSPNNIPSPGTPGGAGGGGAGGTGSALGSGASDPSFFGGDSEKGADDRGSEGAGSAGGRGGRGSSFDEYSPKNQRREDTKSSAKEGGEGAKDKTEASLDQKSRQSLVLSEAKEAERERSYPFDWWLLIKLLIIGLIIFLVILIGLSNMKKR